MLQRHDACNRGVMLITGAVTLITGVVTLVTWPVMLITLCTCIKMEARLLDRTLFERIELETRRLRCAVRRRLSHCFPISNVVDRLLDRVL